MLGASADAAGPPPNPKVDLVTTGDGSERYKTIPITRKPRAERRVVMSLGPSRLPDLDEGDTLRISAELMTTNNCYQQSPFCVSRPYRYSPRIATQLVIAQGLATEGPRALPITSRRERKCDQYPRHREHHCVAVYSGSGFRIPDPTALPCPLDQCRINLVADAHNDAARRGDELILGIDREDGRAHGDRSRLNALRIRGDAVSQDDRSKRRLRRRVKIREKVDTTIYSMRVDDLKAREQLMIEAAAKVSIGHVNYATFVGSELILGTKPRSVHTTQMTRRVAKLRGHLSEANGFNCTQRTTPCRIRKVGTLVMKEDATRGGQPVPLFVNLVMRNAPKMDDRNPGDYMHIQPKGRIDVQRYAAELNRGP